DWSGFDRDYERQRIPLPTYPFERKSFWLKPSPPQVLSRLATAHPLIGQRLKLPFSEQVRFESQFETHAPAYLDQHRLYGTVVVPGASHIAMALLAAQSTLATDSCCLEDVVFTQAITLPERSTRTVQLIFNPQDNAFQIVSLSDVNQVDDEADWQVHANGKLRSIEPERNPLDWRSLKADCPNYLSGSEFYKTFWDAGYTLGAAFRWIDEIWRGTTGSICQMRVPQLPDELSDYLLYPGLIDSCFQFILVDIAADLVHEDYLYVPFAIANFKFYGVPESGAQLWCYATLDRSTQVKPEILTGNITLFDESGRIIAQFDRLEARKASRQRLLAALEKPSIDPLRDRLDRVTWQPQERETTQPLTVGTWLLLADAQGIGSELAQKLQAQGHRCILLTPGASYQQIAKEQYTANPTQPEDFQKVLAQIAADAPLPLIGIVHLWGLTPTSTTDLVASSLLAAQRTSCGSVLSLLQGLTAAFAHQQIDSPRLWLVTQGAQAIGNDVTTLSLEQTPLWGLGRVLAVEHPELRCVRIDLEPTANRVDNLLAEIITADSEDEIAIRQGVRYVPRLGSAPKLRSPQSPPINDRSTYLITGGLGALGLNVADWMTQQGAKQIVLIGRSQPSPLTQAIIDRIEQSGTQVTVIQADISVAADVARLLNEIETNLPPLKGIIHAAGVLDDGILQKMSWERFEKVLAPKLQGSWNLHLLTQHLPLDFWVCFSSISSLIGNPGQSNYAAANAFMDALSHYRSSLKLPSLTINWGAWLAEGMATQVQGLLTAKGIVGIKPELGLSILGELLSQDLPQIAVAPMKWSKFLAQFPTGQYPSLLRDIGKTETINIPSPVKQQSVTFRQQLESAPLGKRRSLVVDRVREQVANVLGLQQSDLKDLQVGFQDLGMDSLMAVELRNRLQSSLGCPLSSTFAFNYPNIEAVTQYLIEQPLASVFAVTETKVAEIAVDNGMVAKVQQMSEQDLELLLLEKLAKLNQ
ncbi:SDR family NAD(P)-dependent oxidoreductase, partial [Chamaesiphon sp. OTE_75_metabat_556]|uniref:SDR family NAD(P)-dependent oxidoreductase n=1 Tax=Chamaesiphon sp. OTE_75_metabat_556 TaxID=2964692 RepID=UPI00286A87CF